jgi:hypothetical protein
MFQNYPKKLTTTEKIKIKKNGEQKLLLEKETVSKPLVDIL